MVSAREATRVRLTWGASVGLVPEHHERCPVTNPFVNLPVSEFAFPGPLRDQLVAAILEGTKVSTTGLVADYEHEGEALPTVGGRSVVVDSQGHPVAVIETTSVQVVALGEVGLRHAVDEGEGHTTVAEWRKGHEAFWHSDEMRASLGDPTFAVHDATMVVLERFVVRERLTPPDPH